MRKPLITLMALASLGLSGAALAKVSADEAGRLGQDLTPVGAERNGNAAGTIPAWNGGLSAAPDGWTPGAQEIDPFPGDKPLFTITAQNMAEHEQFLSDGQKALLTTYPDSYKLPVYPSRRTAAYPQWIYEKLKENALNATLIEDGNGVRNTIATSPFPIPKDGLEVVWNHILRFRGEQVLFRSAFASPTANGDFTPIMTEYSYYFAYSEPGAKLEDIDNKIFYLKTRILSPAKLAGTLNLVHETLDQIRSPRQAWRYESGERRLRRTPNLAYETDLPNSESQRSVDQKDLYNGAPNQYDWTLQGKRELYVPYNAYRLHSKDRQYGDIVKANHINQDHTRYELHRMWVVEGNLRTGMPHIYKKRRFYVDEDSWHILLTEEFDTKDQLWRVSEAHPIVYYSVPALWTTLETTYDLRNKRYFVDGLDNQEPPYNFSPNFNASDFTTSSARREARR